MLMISQLFVFVKKFRYRYKYKKSRRSRVCDQYANLQQYASLCSQRYCFTSLCSYIITSIASNKVLHKPIIIFAFFLQTREAHIARRKENITEKSKSFDLLFSETC